MTNEMNAGSRVHPTKRGGRVARGKIPGGWRMVWALIAWAAGAAAALAKDRIPLKQMVDAGGVRGGLVVVAGSGDVELPAGWREGSPWLVHQLVADHDRLGMIRSRLGEQGVYGTVSAVAWDGAWLPYPDHTVNLLILADEGGALTDAEANRVLAPLGVAIRGGKVVIRKPWPEDMDHWTHSRYDSTGNAASRDRRVGPPRHVQWVAPPRWNRSVKTSCVISSDGRLFFILDDAPFTAESATWALIARDAFSGVRLWRRELPEWISARGGKKVGPIQADRKLVAGAGRVYAPLAEWEPVSILDAADGELLKTLESTRSTEELILSSGVLVVLANPNPSRDPLRAFREDKIILAHDAISGEELWRRPTDGIMPTTLAADHRQVVYHDGRNVISVDLRTGRPRWTSAPTGQEVQYAEEMHPNRPGAEPSVIFIAPQFAPTLMMYGDVVAFAGGGQINVLRADDGVELWRNDRYALSNYSVPVELFGFGGRLWGADRRMDMWRTRDDHLRFIGYDSMTGEIAARVEGAYGFRFAHHRCYQMKAAGDTILASRAGIEFVDTVTGRVHPHHWVRGSCAFGILPANGTIYVPPHNCACYIRAKLAGFHALRSDRTGPPADATAGPRLVRGPAYGSVSKEASEGLDNDWPTYRGNAARSGRARTALRVNPEMNWERRVGFGLSAPVVAGGRVFAASFDDHKLFALDAGSGEIAWDFVFDGPVDSPPTVHRGLVLTGCRDGWVYALRAADGELVWRFNAAPERIWTVAGDRLESVWPIHGSVLVVNDVLYFAAGRSSYLDGGLRLFALDPLTGDVLSSSVVDSLASDGSQRVDDEGVDGCLNDVLSGDGHRIFIRHQAFDIACKPVADLVPHIHSPDGYLGDRTSTRLMWTYAPRYTSLATGATRDNRLSRTVQASGLILAEDDRFIYGYGQNFFSRPSPEEAGEWALFSAPKEQTNMPGGRSIEQYRALAESGEARVGFQWWQGVPVEAWAMLKSDDVLFVAGPVAGDRKGMISAAAFAGTAGSKLVSISPVDGHILAAVDLPGTPVWDGLAAADGRLFMTTRDGRIVCLDARPGDPDDG